MSPGRAARRRRGPDKTMDVLLGLLMLWFLAAGVVVVFTCARSSQVSRNKEEK
jgi:hypothetical protein